MELNNTIAAIKIYITALEADGKFANEESQILKEMHDHLIGQGFCTQEQYNADLLDSETLKIKDGEVDDSQIIAARKILKTTLLQITINQVVAYIRENSTSKQKGILLSIVGEIGGADGERHQNEDALWELCKSSWISSEDDKQAALDQISKTNQRITKKSGLTVLKNTIVITAILIFVYYLYIN